MQIKLSALNLKCWEDRRLNLNNNMEFIIFIKLLEDYQIKMMQNQKPSAEKVYSRITYETRVQLIRLVQKQNISIKEASKLMEVNYSTGKLIMRKYIKNGAITKFSAQRPTKHQGPHQTSISPQVVQLQQNINKGNKQQTQILDGVNQYYTAPFLLWTNNSANAISGDWGTVMTPNFNWTFQNGFCWNF